MITTQRPRFNRIALQVIVLIALTTSLLKIILEVKMDNVRVTTPAPMAKVDLVQLDSAILSPIKVEGKKGELILSVNADDLDDITGKLGEQEIPRLPHILLHDPYICEKTPGLSFIMYVHSAPTNREKRDLLRKTYANTKLFRSRKFVVIFLLGLPKELGVQLEVKREFEQYGDIVQGYFVDDYRNITLKGVMGLNWIHNYCKQTAYALKVDDDTFLNIFEITSLMDAAYNQSLALMCPIWREGTMKILRDKKTCMKWCVTKREFQGIYYPRYCAGIGYVLSRELIKRMKETAEKTPFFWIDDVYITGLLTQRYVDQIHYVDLMSKFAINEWPALEEYHNTTRAMSNYLIHVREKRNFMTLWTFLIKRLSAEQKLTVNELVLNSVT